MSEFPNSWLPTKRNQQEAFANRSAVIDRWMQLMLLGVVETLAFGKHLGEIVACVDLFKLEIKVNLHTARVN